VVIDERDLEVGRWVLPPHDDEALTWADFIPQESLFWRRSLWERVGGAVDESLAFALDWDLILRFRAVGSRFARIPRFLGALRIDSEQATDGDRRSLGGRPHLRALPCAGRVEGRDRREASPLSSSTSPLPQALSTGVLAA
jgi:hypothetical protein